MNDTPRPSPAISALIVSLLIGAVVGAVAWALSSESTERVATARVQIDDLQVRWPFHDAVIESSVALINSAAALERAREVEPEVISVSSALPINQTIFDVKVEATDAAAARSAADAVAEWLVEENGSERTAALEAQIEQLEGSHDTESGREADAQARFDGATTETERVTSAADLRFASGRRAELENEIASLTDQLATTRPQLTIVTAATTEDEANSQLATAVSAGLGAALLAFALLSALRSRRFATPVSDQSFTNATPVSDQSFTNATPVSDQSFTNDDDFAPADDDEGE